VREPDVHLLEPGQPGEQLGVDQWLDETVAA
jgi:hypothetical protein